MEKIVIDITPVDTIIESIDVESKQECRITLDKNCFIYKQDLKCWTVEEESDLVIAKSSQAASQRKFIWECPKKNIDHWTTDFPEDSSEKNYIMFMIFTNGGQLAIPMEPLQYYDVMKKFREWYYGN